jgi:hypothetical protein
MGEKSFGIGLTKNPPLIGKNVKRKKVKANLTIYSLSIKGLAEFFVLV